MDTKRRWSHETSLTDLLRQLGEIQDRPFEIPRPGWTTKEQDDALDAENRSAITEQDEASQNEASQKVANRADDKRNWRTATSRDRLVILYEFVWATLTDRQHGEEKNEKEST